VSFAEPSQIERVAARDQALGKRRIANGERIVLTGSTAELQKFFGEHGRDVVTRELKFKRR